MITFTITKKRSIRGSRYIDPAKYKIAGLSTKENYLQGILVGSISHQMNIQCTTDFITLNKLLKHLGLVDSGGEAKLAITGGLVLVNDEVELRTRRKCFPGDTITFGDELITLIPSK